MDFFSCMHGSIGTIIYFKAPRFLEKKKEKEKMTRRYWNINLEQIKKIVDKIEDIFLLSFIKVLHELSWCLQTYAINLTVDYFLSSRNVLNRKREHSREEDFTFGMSKETLTTFIEELCKEETKERIKKAKYPQSHKDYRYACETIIKWIDTFLDTYRMENIPRRAVFILLQYIRLAIEYWWIFFNLNIKK